MFALLATLAIVTTDDVSLRAAPRDSAPKQAVLYAGDVLEIRGERQGWLQVYDHRRERAGYVQPRFAHAWEVTEAEAPGLLAVVRLLRDSPEREALGIAHAALYLKAAPAKEIGSEVFDALGVMADRLAWRASLRFAGPQADALAAQLEVARSYGVQFKSFERDGRMQICPDGEAFRHVLALGGTAEERARAALSLTRHECVDPAMPVVEKRAFDEWRAETLARVELGSLPAWMAHRVRMRQASVAALLAFERTRAGDGAKAREAAERAIGALAAIDRRELADEDLGTYEETAIRVGASRWAAMDAGRMAAGGASIGLVSKAPGETCVQVLENGRVGSEQCTYGIPWASSAVVSAKGNAIALAVQPEASWLELWVFRRSGRGWAVDVLAPGTEASVGYLEAAGFSPDGSRLLVVREVRGVAGAKRTFEQVAIGTLAVEKSTTSPEGIGAFRKWASANWRAETLALR